MSRSTSLVRPSRTRIVRARLGAIAACAVLAASTRIACADEPAEQPAHVGQGASRPIGAPVWIAAAATGGLATTTIILGLAALGLRNDFDRANGDPTQTPGTRASLHGSALDTEHAATIAGVATLTAAATCLVLYLTRPSRRGAGVRLGLARDRVFLSGGF